MQIQKLYSKKSSYQDLENYQCLKLSEGEYNGQVKDGKREGKGKMEYSKNHIYEGDWAENKKHGHGVEIYPDGTKYEGEFLDDKYHAKGRLTYSNYSYYDGFFNEGVKHGQGTQRFMNGLVYKGSFSNDKPNGRGIFTKGKYSYEGDIEDGQRHGHGIESYPQGGQYDGYFIKNKREGRGKFASDNVTYFGDWKLGMKHGYGVEKIKTDHGEKIYEGEYYYGAKHGFGRLTLENGSFYYGCWNHGKKYKEFLEYDKDEDSYNIKYYENDKEIKVVKDLDHIFPDELNGYIKTIEDIIIQNKPFTDNVFPIESQKVYPPSIDIADVDFAKRITDIYHDEKIVFFSPVNDFIQAHQTFGFYIVKFYIDHNWKQILIDDLIPLLIHDGNMVFSTPNDGEIGVLLIEKAWAKLHGKFLRYNDDLDPEIIMKMLTGLPSKVIQVENEDLLIKFFKDMKLFKIKIAELKPEYLDKQTPEIKNSIPKGFYFIIEELIEDPNLTILKLRTCHPRYLVPSKLNKRTEWPNDLSKRMAKYVDEKTDSTTMWIEIEDFCTKFQTITIPYFQDGYLLNTCFSQGNNDVVGNKNEIRFFEFKITYETHTIILVEQITKNSSASIICPLRIILAKKLNHGHYEYITGKGQVCGQHIERQVLLDQGHYILCVQLEYPQKSDLTFTQESSIDLNIILYAPQFINIMPYPLHINKFLQKVYASCAIKFGERSDLSKFENGSKDLLFYEHFQKEDGTFIQYFENNTENVKWRYCATFSLTNMKIVGFPEHRQQIELVIEPKKEQILIIQQINGKQYEFIGGQGTIGLDKVKKQKPMKIT